MTEEKQLKECYRDYVLSVREEYDKGYWAGTHSSWMTMARKPWKSFEDWLKDQNK